MKIKREEIIAVLGILISVYIYYSNPSDETATFFIGVILILIGILYSVWYLIDKFKEIEKNTKEINNIKKKLEIKEEINMTNQRISKLEGWKEAIENIAMRRKNKGQIDPRIILFIILLIIIFMFLRSQGII
ncbi:MAG: hypothetical protein ISS48_04780 [Candidatus Aenigmarchaeota archaeon]|nr:hypothetical protein [Candidatus Aenigmarchaeota archaeon]